MATSSQPRKNDNRGQKRRGGGSRNRRGGGGSRRNNQQNNNRNRNGRGRQGSALDGAAKTQGQRAPRAPVGPTRLKAMRPSLWQRILGFFKGGSPAAKSKEEAPGNRKPDGRGARQDSNRRSAGGGNGQSPRNRKSGRRGSGAEAKIKARTKPARATDSNHRDKSPEKEKKKSAKQPRTPETIEVTSGRLYVGNLSYDATEDDLQELFKGVGTVTSVEVVSHRYTQRSKGYAFLEMQSVPEAKRAVEELHDKDFMGRPLVVTGAKSKGVRDGGTDSGKGDDAGESETGRDPRPGGSTEPASS